MMKKRIIILIIISMASSSFGAIWTETFDDGVGMLNQTSGNGDSVFVWDSDNNTINGTFNRYHHDGYVYDTMYANLGDVYDVRTSTLGFSAVITPVNSTNDYYNSTAYFGLLGNDTTFVSRLCVRLSRGTRDGSLFNITGRYDDGELFWSGSALAFSWGTMYFIDALLDGSNHEFSVSLYEGTSAQGSFLGTISAQLDPTKPLTIYGLGMANGESVSSPKTFVADLHEMSLTIPEPTTLSLLAIGGLLLRRKKGRL